MNVQNTEARNVFIERSEQGVSAVPVILAGTAPRAGAPTRPRHVAAIYNCTALSYVLPHEQQPAP